MTIPKRIPAWALAALVPFMLVGLWPAQARPLDTKVVQAEKKRVDVINKVKPSVVAVMARDPRGRWSATARACSSTTRGTP